MHLERAAERVAVHRELKGILARIQLRHRTAGVATAGDDRGNQLGGEVAVDKVVISNRDELTHECGRGVRVGEVAAVETELSAARHRTIRVGNGGDSAVTARVGRDLHVDSLRGDVHRDAAGDTALASCARFVARAGLCRVTARQVGARHACPRVIHAQHAAVLGALEPAPHHPRGPDGGQAHIHRRGEVKPREDDGEVLPL
eukprot:scaffold129363_cov63-Phaeocystis_antarctica.AAC.4